MFTNCGQTGRGLAACKTVPIYVAVFSFVTISSCFICIRLSVRLLSPKHCPTLQVRGQRQRRFVMVDLLVRVVVYLLQSCLSIQRFNFHTATKSICAQYDRLRITENSILCRTFIHTDTGMTSDQIIVPHLHRDITDNLHRGLNGGHLGHRRSKLLLQKRFFGQAGQPTSKQQKATAISAQHFTDHALTGREIFSLCQLVNLGKGWGLI